MQLAIVLLAIFFVVQLGTCAHISDSTGPPSTQTFLRVDIYEMVVVFNWEFAEEKTVEEISPNSALLSAQQLSECAEKIHREILGAQKRRHQ